MKHRARVLAAVAGLALTVPAWGQDTGDRRFYVSPMFTYLAVDGDRGLDPGYGGTLFIGKKLTSRMNLEIGGYYLTAGPEVGDGSNATFYSAGGGVMVFPSQTLNWLFVDLTAYYHWGKKQFGFVEEYTSTVFDSGAGVLVPLGFDGNGFVPDGTSLRVEARYRYDQHGEPSLGNGTTDGEDDAYDVAFNVGLLIPLTHTPKEVTEEAAPAPEVVETVAPSDTDGDGVADDADQCPDTPSGSTVDEKGCPAEAATATDCAVPGPGQQANLAGCKEGQAVVLSGVNFETGKASLTDNAKSILDSVAEAMTASADVKVEIGGHTDNAGSDASNQRLSERRARSVKDYLVSKGIAAERMGTKGYGAAQPLVGNDTPEGREQNRRVEFKVVTEVPAEAPAATEPAPAEAAPAPAETMPTESAPTETAPASSDVPPGFEPAPGTEPAPIETAPSDTSAPIETAPSEPPPAETPAETPPPG